MHRRGSSDGFSLFALIVVGIIALLIPFGCGIGGFGPTNTHDVTVNRLYVDHSDHESHYMVGTDQGVFEVDNGIMLGLYNADELYSRMREGHRYHITAKGRQYANIFMQEYPYITNVQPLPDPPVQTARR